MNLHEHLLDIGACIESRIWAKGKTAQEAWEQCEKKDWLLWWAAHSKTGVNTIEDFQKAALAVLEEILLPNFPKDSEVIQKFIQAIKNYLEDQNPVNQQNVYHTQLSISVDRRVYYTINTIKTLFLWDIIQGCWFPLSDSTYGLPVDLDFLCDFFRKHFKQPFTEE